MPSLPARCALVALVFLSGCTAYWVKPVSPDQPQSLTFAQLRKKMGVDQLERRIELLEEKCDARGVTP